MVARRFSLVVLALAAAVVPALAQSPNRLGTFKDWSAYAYSDSSGKVCYAASQPKDSEPKNVNRDPTFFMIANRPAENVHNEASIIIGYPFKPDSRVTAIIDGQEFVLFTKEDGAWVENAAEEATLIAAMKGGRSMVIKGTSARGTDTTDTYSLSGITAAMDRVDQECPAQ
jgi:hypothetical protein